MTAARTHATVFVYGTLLRGEPNHRLLVGARFAGDARTTPRHRLVDLGAFPAMVDGGDTSVAGELYEVDAATLAALDRLEGHPRFYERRPVALADGRVALAYLLAGDTVADHPIITSGDWRKRLGTTTAPERARIAGGA